MGKIADLFDENEFICLGSGACVSYFIEPEEGFRLTIALDSGKGSFELIVNQQNSPLYTLDENAVLNKYRDSLGRIFSKLEAARSSEVNNKAFALIDKL